VTTRASSSPDRPSRPRPRSRSSSSRLRGSRWRGASGALLGYLKALGAAVTEGAPLADEDAAKALRKAGRAATAEVTRTEAERIFNAPVITLAAAKEIRTPSSPAEADSITRAYILDFYGTVSTDLIKWDNQGAGRRQARAFARFLAYQTDPAKVLALDNRDRANRVPTFGLVFHSLHAKICGNILAAAGFDVSDPSTWDTVLMESETMPRGVATYAKKNRRALEEMGIAVNGDVAAHPVKMVNAVLAKLGLRVGRRTAAGHNLYTVSTESLATMTEKSAAYLDRLLNPQEDEAPALPPVAPPVQPPAPVVPQEPIVTVPPTAPQAWEVWDPAIQAWEPWDPRGRDFEAWDATARTWRPWVAEVAVAAVAAT
jgi:hypothetical protein